MFCVIIPIINKKKDSQTNQIKYSAWDKTLIIFTIISFGLSVAVFIYTQDQSEIKDKQYQDYQTELRNKLAERDSIHQIKDSLRTIFFTGQLDSSYVKSIQASNEALAKYNLVLIDSMRTVANKINIKAINNPQLIISAIEPGATPPIYLDKKEGKDYINIKFMSENNISYNIDVKYYLLECEKLGSGKFAYSTIDTGFIFYKRSMLAQDRFTTTQIELKPEFLNLDCSIILMLGSFSSDLENKNRLPFKDLLVFDIKNNKMIGIPDGDFLEGVISSLKRRGIIK